MMRGTRCSVLLLLLSVVFSDAARTAKMPNLSDDKVAKEYTQFTDRRLLETWNTSSASGSSFRLPDSVNNLKVKTNSSSPHKNEKNVTMNLNIPASVNDFVLEEIDLKYVKKLRKKSKSDKVSNLFIKYFTNRSSNLHLSSVTKEEGPRAEFYHYEDLKERRDNPENREAVDEPQSFERPFRFQNKYPLRLLEKVRSSNNRLKKMRQAKRIEGDMLNVNGHDERLRRSSNEEEMDLTEDDLLALESILVNKTVTNSEMDPKEIDRYDSSPAFQIRKEQEIDLALPDIIKIFEKTVETNQDSKDDQKIKETYTNGSRSADNGTGKVEPQPHVSNKAEKTQDLGSWFSKQLPQYFFSVLQPFRPGMFSGGNILPRRKRSTETDKISDDAESREEPYKKFKYSYVKNPRLKHKNRLVAPLFSSKTSAPKRPTPKKILGFIKQIPDDIEGPSDYQQKDHPASPSLQIFSNFRSPISAENFIPLKTFELQLNKPTEKDAGLTREEVQRKLSKLDYYFSSLKVEEEECRQRLLCEVAQDPVHFAPLAEMFTLETRLAEGTGAVGAGAVDATVGDALVG
ncbi:uncharacterized protein LOC108678253, partial [Hyalella azteca]|uniref:Uncharacterized protein LOC108678253 n=1 Tax=Hyalella azteca TaxID=294128 RepID=A0A8B7P816_HYAAZ